ncbi:hypothetical protein [Streptomyces sp. NPDC058486]|uniref:hypothetical protein n=1 Tax=unclassified Streptomyces TaxID=2593676 RepID=UPI00366642B7
MIAHHLVLDTPSLLALSGNRHVSALIHRAHFEPETRLWVPVLSALEADAEHPGMVEHVDRLDVIHTLDLDRAGMLTVARLGRSGFPAGIAAAVHAVRHLPDPGADALIATVTPEAYEGQGVPVLGLDR